MKRVLTFLLALCVAAGLQAQVSESGHWYSGSLNYSALNQAGGRVLMTATAEGEELGFQLVPVAGKKDAYTVADAPDDVLNNYEGCTVRHQKGDGLDVLCFYDADGKLKAVMSNEDEWDSEKLNCQRWMSQLAGEYFFNEVDGETRIRLSDQPDEDGCYGISVDGVLSKVRVVTFNGSLTGFIRISEMGGTPFMGTWEVVPTLEDLVLYEVEEDPESYFFDWKRTGMAYYLTKADNGNGKYRFEYARTTLLNDKQFRRMDKAAIRVMRNYILARHGYKFSSPDLQRYFSEEGWYQPRNSNDGISEELTLLERLNIELIRSEE